MNVAMPAAEPHQPAPPPSLSAVRLRQEGLPANDRQYAVWLHLAPLIAFMVVGPLAVIVAIIMWQVRNNASPFVDDHGREVVNFAITGVLVTFLAFIPVIGWIGAPIWMIVGLVNLIRGSMAASNGEYFRYPLTIRFIS